MSKIYLVMAAFVGSLSFAIAVSDLPKAQTCMLTVRQLANLNFSFNCDGNCPTGSLPCPSSPSRTEDADNVYYSCDCETSGGEQFPQECDGQMRYNVFLNTWYTECAAECFAGCDPLPVVEIPTYPSPKERICTDCD